MAKSATQIFNEAFLTRFDLFTVDINCREPGTIDRIDLGRDYNDEVKQKRQRKRQETKDERSARVEHIRYLIESGRSEEIANNADPDRLNACMCRFLVDVVGMDPQALADELELDNSSHATQVDGQGISEIF